MGTLLRHVSSLTTSNLRMFRSQQGLYLEQRGAGLPDSSAEGAGAPFAQGHTLAEGAGPVQHLEVLYEH